MAAALRTSLRRTRRLVRAAVAMRHSSAGSVAIIATMFILFSLEYWNNLLWPLIVFRKQENMPLAVGLAGIVNQYKIQYDLLLAGSALATIPIIVLFLLLRRQFMQGASFTGTGVQ